MIVTGELQRSKAALNHKETQRDTKGHEGSHSNSCVLFTCTAFRRKCRGVLWPVVVKGLPTMMKDCPPIARTTSAFPARG